MAVIFGSIFIARYVKPIDAKIEPKLETKPTPSAVTAE
jgi:hypothetical protein